MRCRVPLIIGLFTVVCLTMLPGCSGKKAHKTVPINQPVVTVADVIGSHVYYESSDLLKWTKALSGSRRHNIFQPLSLSDINPGGDANGLDVESIRRGLSGRIEAALSRYGASVDRRENRSARLAAHVAEEELRIGLDSKIAAMGRTLGSDIFQARTRNAAEISRLRLDISLLSGRSRVLSEPPDSPVERDIAVKRAKIGELERQVEGEIAALQEKYLQDVDAARQWFDSESEAVLKQRLAEARVAADEQISKKASVAKVRTYAFTRDLQKLAQAKDTWETSRRSNHADRKIGISPEVSRILRDTAQSIDQDMAADGEIAVRLIRSQQTPSTPVRSRGDIIRSARKLLTVEHK